MQKRSKHPQIEAEDNARLDFTDRWIQWVFSVLKAKILDFKMLLLFSDNSIFCKGL